MSAHYTTVRPKRIMREPRYLHDRGECRDRVNFVWVKAEAPAHPSYQAWGRAMGAKLLDLSLPSENAEHNCRTTYSWQVEGARSVLLDELEREISVSATVDAERLRQWIRDRRNWRAPDATERAA